jgi:predicted dehydrogenase
MEIQEAILVGVGSVGKTHLQHLTYRFKKITLIDPKIEEIKRELETPIGAEIKFKKSIQEISSVTQSTLVVIANWGPNHYEVLEYFTKLGIKKFLIEKPLVDSLKDLSSMKKYQKKYQLQIITHIPILNAKFTRYLEMNEKTLGKPIAINIFGGAKCIATNGIHYIALANKLFLNRPIAVGGYMHSDPINPREASLSFYEGCVFWRYPEQKQLCINFSNSSQVNLKIEILYKYAKAEVYNDTFKLTKIPDIDIESLKKPSSTRYSTEMIYEGEAYADKIGNNETSELYNMFKEEIPCNIVDYGFGATEDLISSIIASRKQKLIDLPLKNITKLYYFNKKWKIS